MAILLRLVPHQRLLTQPIFLLLCCVSLFSGPVLAQLPTASLRTVWPCVVEAGRGVDVVVQGEFLDESNRLTFSDSRITASVKTGPPLTGESDPSIQYGHFTLELPSDTADQMVEVRSLGRFGLSNPRRMVIQNRPVLQPEGQRFSPEQSLEIGAAETVLARCSGQQVDHYKLVLEKGSLLRVQCQALEIDSTLLANITLCDSENREVSRSRATKSADAMLAYPIPETGTYIIKVHDVLFRGGDTYFYCLQIDRAAATTTEAEPGGRLAWRSTIDSNVHLTSIADIKGLPTSDAGTTFLPPQILTGTFDERTQATVDFDFDAKAGQRWNIEVISADAGAATDPDMQIGRLRPEADGSFKFERLHHFDDTNILPGSLLGQLSKDPKHRFVVPEDGRYRVRLRDLQTTSGESWNKSFNLAVRPGDPDFEILAFIPHSTLDPARSVPVGTLMRRGDRLAIEVAVRPLDGFFEPIRTEASIASGKLTVSKEIAWNWPIEVTIENLPTGLSAKPIKLDNVNRLSHIILEASDDVVDWGGAINVVGTVSLPPEFGGQTMSKNAETITVQLADPDGRGRPLVRQSDDLQLATTNKEAAPLNLALGGETVEFSGKVGANIEIPLNLIRSEHAKGKVTIRAAGLPPNVTAAEVNLEGETLAANLTLTIPANVPVGNYQIFVNAETELPWPRNPESLARTEARLENLKQQLEAAEEAQKEALAKQVSDVEAQVNQLKEATKPQNTRVFIPSNSVAIQIVPA